MVLRMSALVALLLGAIPAAAEDRRFSLRAPDALVDTGFLQHLLPRFSLKTGIRIAVNGDAPLAAFDTEGGVPVFEADDTIWRYDAEPGPLTDRFFDWLTSDVGQRTIASFQRDGAPVFTAAKAVETETAAVAPTGDAALGEGLSMTLCGRCHVVNERNRMNAIGSTPSFAVLRTFGDWIRRFESFYALRPHPAFTQVDQVTAPFDPALPSPIVPVELTLDDLDAILAYVATIPPADLGAPIQSQ